MIVIVFYGFIYESYYLYLNYTFPCDMHATLIYSLGGAALGFTVILTVLSGLCCAWSASSSFESTTVSLNAVSCVGLIFLLLLRQTNPLKETWSWKNWRLVAHGLFITYLLVAAGVTAGTIATSTATAPALSLFVTRNVFWALSVFLQAFFSGFLLVSETKRSGEDEDTHQWPRPLSHELDMLQGRSNARNQEGRSDSPASIVMDSCRQSMSTNRKTSNDGLAPAQACCNMASRVSSRFSGRTLFQHDSNQTSVDLHAGVTSSLNRADAPEGRDSPMDQGRQTATATPANSVMLQRSNSENRHSAESLVILPSPGPPSPTDSSTNLESGAVKKPPLPKLQLPTHERNIHPLFRADSPSPPPTPMPGTMVKASPVAGTTITTKTLNRVRSSNSLRVNNNGRSRSPLLLERMSVNQEEGVSQAGSSSAPTPGNTMAGDVRRSSHLQYEKKYNLNESPLEG